MELKTLKVAGRYVTYKVVNGVGYNVNTPDDLIKVLERIRVDRIKIQINLGSQETGEDWAEENDTIGYMGRSTGEIAIPLFPIRKGGGSGLLDNCVVKIRTSGGKVLWQHPKYKAPKITLKMAKTDLPFELYVNNQHHASLKSMSEYQKLEKKLS